MKDERKIIKKIQGQKYKGEITWKYILECLNCGKHFNLSGAVFNRGEGQTCGVLCRSKRHGKVVKERGIIPWIVGKNKNDYPQLKGYWNGKKLSEEHRKKLSLSPGHKNQRNRLGAKHSVETRKKLREWALKNPNHYWLGKSRPEISGDKCFLWRGGNYKKKYPKTFSDALKNRIRKRDNLICQLCSKHQDTEYVGKRKSKLAIHHIDYVKENCEDKNLIALCNSCHDKTGFDRPNWIIHFQNLINKIYS